MAAFREKGYGKLHKVEDTDFLEEGQEAIPSYSFEAHLERMTLLDPIKLFGEMSEEAVRVFQRGYALTLNLDATSGQRGNQEPRSSRASIAETIEISSDDDVSKLLSCSGSY